jgi:thiopeptide-type bacteriocin biosynthesis protein
VLLRLFETAARRGARQIELGPDDLEGLRAADPPPLPGAFAATAVLAAASETALARGDWSLYLAGASGPSGARLFGRFCHADPALRRHVEGHLRAEETLAPGAVFAEVVHLPEGRVGNILCRPLLRDYEIPYLGHSGAPAGRQLPVTDLLVSAAGGEIVLRSRRLGCRGLPRLTSAHNYAYRSLGVYRFLYALQGEGAPAGFGWDWGALGSAAFRPRVVAGRLVLARARWRVGKEELDALAGAGGAARFRAVQAWRAERRLPRWALLSDGDNELPVDLDNVLCVEAFLDLVKGRDVAFLVEMFPEPDMLCARGPEGRFVHELVIPFVRRGDAAPRRDPRPAAAAAPPLAVRRRFPPGSEWLYAKLYAGSATADQVLRDVVGPVTRSALGAGAADGWFFLRYGDPDSHLRWRLHGDAGRLRAEIWPALLAAAEPLIDDGRLWRVQFDTYEREVERYGGADGVLLAERLFQADSEAVVALLGVLAGDAGSDACWRLALRGIDLLLADLGFDLRGKRAVLKRARELFAADYRDGVDLRHQLGARFRQERRKLEALFDPAGDAAGRWRPAWRSCAAARTGWRRWSPSCGPVKGPAGCRRRCRTWPPVSFTCT